MEQWVRENHNPIIGLPILSTMCTVRFYRALKPIRPHGPALPDGCKIVGRIMGTVAAEIFLIIHIPYMTVNKERREEQLLIV